MISKSSSPELTPEYSPSLALSKNRSERRALQFFQEETAQQLSGLFEERFWVQCVLQIANYDDTVQHAIYAFSSFHENFIGGRNLDLSDYNFALRQYEVAIQKACISAQQPKSLFVCFVTSLMFLSIESIQGNTASVVHLSKHSRTVFDQLKSDKTQFMASDEEFAEMQAFVQRIEIHADKLLGGALPELCVRPKDGIRTLPSLPGRFFSLQQARDYLENLLYQFRQAFFKLDDPLESIARQRLLEWIEAVEDLEKRLDLDKPRERQALALIKMHKLNYQLLCKLPGPLDKIDHDEAFWETQHDNFEKIVNLAAEATGMEQPQKPFLTFNYGITCAMLNTGMRCRDPIIRRKAIAVLRASNQLEFVWHSRLAAASLQRFMEIEEAGLGTVRSASDIPITSRLCQTKRAFGATSNSGTIEYVSRWKPYPIREKIWHKDGCFVLHPTCEIGCGRAVVNGLRVSADAAAIQTPTFVC